MIERAYKKLALDALVIQQGRLAEQKSKCLSTEIVKCIGFFHIDMYCLLYICFSSLLFSC